MLTGTKILTPSQVILGSADVHGDDEVDDGDDIISQHVDDDDLLLSD